MKEYLDGFRRAFPGATTAATAGPTASLGALIYELRLPADRAAKLDTAALAKAGGAADFQKALQALGETKLLYRIDQGVSLAGDRIVIRKRVPVVVHSAPGELGQTIRTIAYKDTGVVFAISGKPRDDGSIDMRLDIELAVLSDSTPLVPGFRAPATRKVKLAQVGLVQIGKPCVSAGAAAASDDKAVMYVARVVLGAVHAGAEPAPKAASPIGSATSAATQPAGQMERLRVALEKALGKGWTIKAARKIVAAESGKGMHFHGANQSIRFDPPGPKGERFATLQVYMHPLSLKQEHPWTQNAGTLLSMVLGETDTHRVQGGTVLPPGRDREKVESVIRRALGVVWGKRDEDGLRCRLEVPAQPFVRGKEAHVTIVIQNAGDRPVTIADLMGRLDDKGYGLSYLHPGWQTLQPPGGLPKREGDPPTVALAPGASLRRRLAVNAWTVASDGKSVTDRVGKYRLRGYYTRWPHRDPPRLAGTIYTLPADIEIRPAGGTQPATQPAGRRAHIPNADKKAADVVLDLSSEEMLKEYDKDGDGELSGQERQVLMKDLLKRAQEQLTELALRRYDADKNGALDADERAQMVQGADRLREQARKAQQEWNKSWDKDGDGKFSAEEAKQLQGESAKLKAEWINRWDMDGDGKLSDEERRVAQWVGRAELEKRRLEMDSDGDGQVSPQESQAYWQKIQAKYDLDKDGKLSDEEQQRMRKHEALGAEAWILSGGWRVTGVPPATQPAGR